GTPWLPMPGACEFRKMRFLSFTSDQSNGPEASCPPLKAVVTLGNLAGTNQPATVGAGLRPARVQPLAGILCRRGFESRSASSGTGTPVHPENRRACAFLKASDTTYPVPR